ncbi:hypothetical protein ASPVEDRAFT_789873 [Aspergillus versicolor CBS 583.65]|uniref:Uncharacterized protein n=1 Tax=Aspergillus versicolor CBS 583.65 TaxID=1036611 RepID=A0A1L9PSL5_ASPVE|nr:uncharacterized protein ASPVEDRAFT_789873 [Aspergillus versicolor CBS 583.65]OJJ04483.1 hypothetical protein ASPVEDRAFT_789873 [Aspergillus versicolor CBS 583.65]
MSDSGMRAGWVVVVCCGMRRSEDGGGGGGELYRYAGGIQVPLENQNPPPSRGLKIGMTALVTGGTVMEGEVHAKQRRVPTVAADGCLGRMTRGTNLVPPSAVLFLSCRLCFSLFLALWRACRQSDWPNPCFLLPSVGQLLLLAIPFAVVGVEESPPKKASCG